MKTPSRLSCAAVILSSALLACEGSEGPTGPAGPAGAQGDPGQAGTPGASGNDGSDGSDGTDGMDGMDAGTTEISGTVSSSVGTAAEGTPVALVAIDDEGVEVLTFGGTLTDANGDFSLTVDDDVSASTRLALVSSSDGEDLAGPVSGATGVAVDPVSTGVLSAMLLITETPDGRVLADYTPAEYMTLYTAADGALTTAGTDRSDAQAVLDEIVDSVGGQVADLSEGAYTTAVFALPAPPDVSAAFTFPGVETNLVAGDGAVFDIQQDGEVDDGVSGGGNSDACDDCFRLRVDGTTFTGTANAQLEDGTELVLGPTTIAGLDVTRKIYVAPNGPPIIRYTDIFSNPSAAAITVDIELFSDFGADGGGGVINTSSSDTTIDASDTWFYLNDSLSDAMVAIWPGSGTTTQTGNTANHTATWSSVVVPANGQVTLVHFGAFFDDGTSNQEIEGVLTGLPTSYTEGLNQADFGAAINAASPPFAIDGEAGAVGSFADVTITNVTTTETQVIAAGSDGSFFASIVGATGDSMTVVATDGTNDAFMLP